jgi:hypothetical protein
MSKGFKTEIMNSLGSGIRCSTSCVGNQRITTFSIVNEDLLMQKRRNSTIPERKMSSPEKKVEDKLIIKRESSWGIQLK